MKSRFGLIFVVLSIIFFFLTEAQAVDWVLYCEAKDWTALYCYDPQSIKRTSKDIVQVWTKASYSKKGLQKWIEKLGPKYKELSYDIALYEYNCSEKKNRCLSLISYNQDGGVIDSETYGSSFWEFIIPDSINESLFNIVCGHQERKDNEIPCPPE